MRYKTVLIGMVSVAAGFALVLTVAFRLQANGVKVSDDVFGAAVAVSIAGVSCGIAAILFWISGPRWSLSNSVKVSLLRADARRADSEYRKRKRLRIAELAADPARSKYAVMMERAGYWSDEQIEYTENPDLTASCPHLRPIEHAMRLAGITPYLFTESWEKNFAPLLKIEANCRVNEAELIRRFPLPESVRYQEGFMPERAAMDNPWARLWCVACQSSIDLVHPQYPRPETRWFPKAPV